MNRREFIATGAGTLLAAMADHVYGAAHTTGVKKMNNAEYIDIHGHCAYKHGYKQGGLDCYCTPEQLLKFYDMHGVIKGVLLPTVNPECSTEVQSVFDVLQMSKECDRFIPFCNVDPRSLTNSLDAPFGDMLKYYKDQGFRGLGEVCANLHFLDPRVQALMKGAEEVGFSFTFQISPFDGYSYGLVDEPGLPELEICLQRFPKLRFFGHSQSFWCEMAEYSDQNTRFGYPSGPIEKEGAIPRLMRKYPNLYGDLSAGSGANALIRDRQYGIKFINEFQDRLMFGMDLCQPDAERSYKPLLPPYLRELRDKGEISQTVFAKVARDNAIRELGLPRV